MKIEDVKIGMRVVTGELWHFRKDAGFVESIHSDAAVWVIWDSDGGKNWISVKNIEPEVKTEQEFSLKNVKINVQKYADDNGITLAQAHKEVQEWLFGHGYGWEHDLKKCCSINEKYLFTDSFKSGFITHNSEEDHFENHRNKEITLQRTVAVTLTPAFVETPVEEVIEYVELGGRKYVKKDLEEALSKIKAVEEGK